MPFKIKSSTSTSILMVAWTIKIKDFSEGLILIRLDIIYTKIHTVFTYVSTVCTWKILYIHNEVQRNERWGEGSVFSRCRLPRPDQGEGRALRLPFLLREWLSFEMLSQIFWMSLEQMTMVSQMQAHVIRCTVEVNCALDIYVYISQTFQLWSEPKIINASQAGLSMIVLEIILTQTICNYRY